MPPALSRHYQIFKVHAIDVVQFRLRALIWMVVGIVNTMIILLFWWATLSGQSTTTSLHLPTITSYYLLMMVLATIGICHLEDDVAYRDIGQGQLHTYLLKPYPYLLKKFHEELVWRLLNAFWATVLLGIILMAGLKIQISLEPQIWLLTAVSLLLGMLCSFFLKVTLGLTSIWLTNIRGLMNIYQVVEIVLAGFVIPLSLFPQFIRPVMLISPFAAQVYYPVQILTASLPTSQIGLALMLQVLWVAIFFLVARSLLKIGIRHYTGVSQ